MKVTISVESYDLGDSTVTRECDDTGSIKKDQAALKELLNETHQATLRSFNVADPF